MSLQIQNTKTKRLDAFVPPASGPVRYYVCGPTVYDRSHLGHGRSYVFYDAVKRTLRHFGHDVLHVQNFTDIEESIALRAKKEGITALAFAERYIDHFLDDMDRLFVTRADHYPRVSETIPEVLDIVDDLARKNAAYTVDCGERGCDVYFDASKAPAFGSLMGQSFDDIITDRPVKGDRRSAADFALWKSTDDWGATWPSKWGDGRPGWHVECTAMASKFLGPTIDIHGGGLDLIFPHHDSEQAIGETWSGQTYTRYFVHNGFVTLDSTKMSKSLGNVVRVHELLEQHDAEALRAVLLSTHYSETLAYREDAITKWEERVGRWREHADDLREAAATGSANPGRGDTSEASFLATIDRAESAFDDAVGNDFSFEDAIPVGEALLKDAAARASNGTLSAEESRAVCGALARFGRALGFPTWEGLAPGNGTSSSGARRRDHAVDDAREAHEGHGERAKNV